MHFFACTAALALVICYVPAIACSPAPPPLVLDMAGKPVNSPVPVRRHEFNAVVLGMAEVEAPPRLPGWPATKVHALRVRVSQATVGTLSVGSEHSIYFAGIGADCLPEAVSVPASWFPVGSLVSVRTDNLVTGSIERAKDRKP